MDPQDREHSSPHDPPPPPGSPYDAPPPGSPYDAPPHGSAQYPQQQPSPYGAPGPGSPYDPQVGSPLRRSAARTVFGIIALVLGGLLALGALANLANGGPSDFASGAEQFGYLLASILFPALFILAGVLLLRRPRR